MPEIAEVENARRQCHRHCLSKKVTHVETVPDELVFSGNTATEFAESIKGKMVVDTKRWGKYFILLFDKEPHLVAHFGMTGDLKFKHEMKSTDTWPPRFWKTIITFSKSSKDPEPMVMAFCDARRLGRLRLVSGDPMKSPPISKLGFDPLNNLPNKEEFTNMVRKRAVPIKALLLDQAFSAGVGNWIADEILYHSRLHPAQYSNSLTEKECETLRTQMEKVCRMAVEAEADESLLPEDWLMAYRWNKGKGKGAGVLPNGHKLSFITVGGRTSAFAADLQKLRGAVRPVKVTNGKKRSSKAKVEEEDNDNDNMTDVKDETAKKSKKLRTRGSTATSMSAKDTIIKNESITGESTEESVNTRRSPRLRKSA